MRVVYSMLCHKNKIMSLVSNVQLFDKNKKTMFENERGRFREFMEKEFSRLYDEEFSTMENFKKKKPVRLFLYLTG